MARCIPDSLDGIDRSTAGEKQVLGILKRLPDDCIVWYEVILAERNYKPDFMVLDPRRGVLIIEVKDWGKSSIKGADSRHFRVQMDGKRPVQQPNPELKCQSYLLDAKELLSIPVELVDERNRLVIPIDYFVAFPNLRRSEFDEISLDQVLNRDHVLFAEEIRANMFSAFERRLESLLPTLKEPLRPIQIRRIREQLRTETTIDLPVGPDGMIDWSPRDVVISPEGLPPDVFAIDLEQEEIAKGLGEGPRLMRGAAGSGKTLIMLMRAKLIASNAVHEGKPERILIVCWNISLANYMRQVYCAPFFGHRIAVRY